MMIIMIKELVITNAIGMNHCKSTVILFHEKKNEFYVKSAWQKIYYIFTLCL